MPARTKISFDFDQSGLYYRFPRLKSQECSLLDSLFPLKWFQIELLAPF